MEFFQQIDWNTVITILAVVGVIGFISLVFMTKGGCGTRMCGVRGSSTDNKSEPSDKDKESTAPTGRS